MSNPLPRTRIVRRAAPIGGWNTRDPLELMAETDAPYMTNWIPAPGGLKQRPGYAAHITRGTSGIVGTLAEYAPPSGSAKLFAAIGADIYDVTSAGSLGASVYGSGALVGNIFGTTMFNTAAVSVLFFVNGADAPFYYDGSSWTAPSITGVTPSSLAFVASHKNRLWFFKANSLSAYYLPNNSVSGAATEFNIGPQAKRGGKLMSIATWTRDGGLGPDDYIVFLTSKGEAIVYAGTDPSSAATWGLVGVFQLPPPIAHGRHAMTRVGGDLVIMTARGLIPMSLAMTLAESGQVNSALTGKISPTFAEAAAAQSSSQYWQVIEWPKEQLLICNVPTGSTTADQYVMQTETLGWCRWCIDMGTGDALTGDNVMTWGVFGGDLYFGDHMKGVWKMTGSSDALSDDTTVASRFIMAFNDAGSPNVKRVTQTRSSMLAALGGGNVPPDPTVTIRTDYNASAPATGDDSPWPGTGSVVTNSKWLPNVAFGHTLAPAMQVRTLKTWAFNSIDIMFDEGGAL